MSQERYVINVTLLNLRSAAEKNDNVLHKLSHGQTIDKMADAGDGWWEVEAVRHGKTITGFIQAEFVKPREKARLDPDALTDLARTFARQFQTSSVLLVSIAYAESDLQDQAKDASGRVGIFGFRGDMWDALVEKHAQTGVTPAMINEWDKQVIVAAVACGQDYGPGLRQALGRAPKAVELYAAHCLGLPNAKALIAAGGDTPVDKALTAAGVVDAKVRGLLQANADVLGEPESARSVKQAMETLAKKLNEGIVKANKLMGMNELDNLGSLSRAHESNGKPEAIGHDDAGGWSYGLYQLASLKGSIKTFLSFLRDKFPNFAQALEQAGGDRAAQDGDPGFKQAWRTLAQDPEFSKAQHDFIKTKYYDRCAKKLEKAGLPVPKWPAALHEVIWSVSVQHGVSGGVDLFKSGLNPLSDPQWREGAKTVNALYNERSKLKTYFPSVEKSLWPGLRSRFETERAQALAMLV